MSEAEIINGLKSIGFTENTWYNPREEGSHLASMFGEKRDAMASIYIINRKREKIKEIAITLTRGTFNSRLQILTYSSWAVNITGIKKAAN